MKVLITHNYYLQLDAKQWETQKPYPPLATLYAAANVRESGHEVVFHDVQFQPNASHFEQVVAEHKPDVVVLYEDGFNYLTKMCLTNMRVAAFEMIKSAAKFNAKVVVSGSDSTDHFKDYIAEGADVVIFGEADETLIELLDEKPNHEVPGIAYLENEEVKSTPKRKVLKELDNLPYPAWDLIDITPYQKAWSQHGYFSINIATTRGCPYKCNWCAKPIYGNRYNSHSPEYIVELIKRMQAQFDFDHIWFCDDIFGLKPGWVQAFSKEMQKANLKIPFKIQSRGDLLVVEDTVKALADAGCDEVWIGAESGSQDVLDAMDKGTTIHQIEESTRMMKQHGIKPCFFLQFGYPGEQWTDIEATINMIEKLKPYDIGISVSYPLPGTLFYDRVQSELSEKANWSDSDELLLMYRGTYSAEFYKVLHRYVHRKFRAASAWTRLQSNFAFKDVMKVAYHKPLEWKWKRKTHRLLEQENEA
ncbi:MAG: B12-binding domain-containing radical SAM protein [Flavobacteriia bacterium]|nr:B12-binding domain-containing radical SAM protein [Flavobacteriia bacterium]